MNKKWKAWKYSQLTSEFTFYPLDSLFNLFKSFVSISIYIIGCRDAFSQSLFLHERQSAPCPASGLLQPKMWLTPLLRLNDPTRWCSRQLSWIRIDQRTLLSLSDCGSGENWAWEDWRLCRAQHSLRPGSKDRERSGPVSLSQLPAIFTTKLLACLDLMLSLVC